jgi:hypothetical protein
VPILLPSGVVLPQNARPPALVQTEDGYFATYQMARFDAIVNGTKRAFATGADAANNDPQNMTFSVTDGAASLAFSRFGADYLIDFECRQTEGSESCITEQDARAFADSLFVQQTQ